MTTIKSFHTRLKKIGIEIRFFGNYPWIYMDSVNGKKVQGTFLANHGFTAFFMGTKGIKITDIPTIFNKIRETLRDT